jgi:hypothetical protein
MQRSCNCDLVAHSIAVMPLPAAPSQTGRRRLLPTGRNRHDAEILRLAVPAFGALVAEPLFLLADAASSDGWAPHRLRVWCSCSTAC